MRAAAPVRWAVLGTAGIAAHAFLPAMRAAGDVAVVVGSRDPDRAAEWATENRIERATSYEDALAAGDVDAVYVAVPNDRHVALAGAAAATGRAVLCEKPLGLDAAEVADLLGRCGDALLWEAFVFPFHPQTALLAELAGVIGGVREIVSDFHFRVTRPGNIRWAPERGGGALLDVGCYPIRLARLLFGAEPVSAAALATGAASGVDAELAAVLDFPGERRLVFSAGMRRAPSTFTRVIGEEGELRITNPYHPRPGDSVELWRDGRCRRAWPSDPAPAFEYAARHVAGVLRGAAAPRHLAASDALGNAVALDLVRAALA